jgi:histidinol phosphatase-like PHP family hydrolase
MNEDRFQLTQDLHMHTTYSTGDSAVVPAQTVSLIARLRHARVLGISDHFDYLCDGAFEAYAEELKSNDIHVGAEVNGADWVDAALDHPLEYYVYHCWNENKHYRALERLVEAGKPVIVAHPGATDTNLDRVPPEALVEINNRYVWRSDWYEELSPYVERFRFVFSSDAHQPNWLNQTVSRYVAAALGITEHLVFHDHVSEPTPAALGEQSL